MKEITEREAALLKALAVVVSDTVLNSSDSDNSKVGSCLTERTVYELLRSQFERFLPSPGKVEPPRPWPEPPPAAKEYFIIRSEDGIVCQECGIIISHNSAKSALAEFHGHNALGHRIVRVVEACPRC